MFKDFGDIFPSNATRREPKTKLRESGQQGTGTRAICPLPPTPTELAFAGKPEHTNMPRLPNVVNVNLSNLHCRVLDQGIEEFLERKIH